ncbi:MAG: DNA replication and repair protein RecF [Saprospiraceae bacterium]|nr:DNA replication and repair protein RecF [Saprospiraceae bacterium]
MHLGELSITHFKNYASQKLSFSEALNCFVGLNGMGKTNLLDAVHYLCMGKSLFGLNDRNIVKHGEDFFRLEGRFALDGKTERIVAKVIPGKQKEIERNGVAYARLSEHVGLIPVVFMAPDDTLLVREGSEERRKFLDNTISQLNDRYLSALIQYNRLLNQRNSALKQFAESRSFNADLLDIYDRQIIPHGQLIYRVRQSFMEAFRPVLREVYTLISGEREEADCRYRSKMHDKPLGELLTEAREKDRYLQRTTVGLHKDDLLFTLDGHPLKRFGSQGQLKSFVLSLKIAQYELLRREKSKRPLLLLDDIFDKLDRQRVGQLLQLLLRGSFGQIFLTDTDGERVEKIVAQMGMDYRIFQITDGRAEPFE